MLQRPPEVGLLAEALHVAHIAVGEGTELLTQLLSGIAVLVGTDIEVLAAEDRVGPREVLAEERVDELVGLRIEDVQVVIPLILGRKLGAVVGEGQRMGGDVDLRDDVHVLRLGLQLQVDELALRVGGALRC